MGERLCMNTWHTSLFVTTQTGYVHVRLRHVWLKHKCTYFSPFCAYWPSVRVRQQLGVRGPGLNLGANIRNPPIEEKLLLLDEKELPELPLLLLLLLLFSLLPATSATTLLRAAFVGDSCCCCSASPTVPPFLPVILLPVDDSGSANTMALLLAYLLLLRVGACERWVGPGTW